MKKVLSLILAVMMLLTMTCVLTACGDTTTDDNNGDANANPFPAALTNVEACLISDLGDLSATGWTFSGGMLDGVEMEQDEADAILAACGGTFQFNIVDSSKAQLVNGETVMDGTYSVVADGYFIDAAFEGYSYYGAFTQVNEGLVLILVNKNDSTSAFYMLQIDEK